MKTLSLLSLTILLFASCTKEVQHSAMYNKFKTQAAKADHIIITMNQQRDTWWFTFKDAKQNTTGYWWQTDVPTYIENTKPDIGTYTLIDIDPNISDAPDFSTERGRLVLQIHRNAATIIDSAAGNYKRTGTWQLLSSSGEFAYLKKGGGILTNTIHYPRYTEQNDGVDFQTMEFDLEGLGQ